MKRSKLLSYRNDPLDVEFYEVIHDVVHHPITKNMRIYMQHSGTNCYQHCLHVAYYNFRICKKLHLDARAAARAGVIHDLFLYDWRVNRERTGDATHAFSHPRTAFNNAKRHFGFSKKEEEIVTKHMWPVTVIPPRYPETYVIVFTDKFCGLCEFIDYYVRKIEARRKRKKKA